MRYDENWAVAPERIEAFFSEQPDVEKKDRGFIFGGCSITLIPLEGQVIGKWAIPRTRIIIEGEDAAAQEIHRRFFLRFLSAGG